MPGLSETLATLARFSRRLESWQPPSHRPTAPRAKLVETASFGSNPGALRMLSSVPPDLPAGSPLVVLLHGCTQTASGYDAGTGWSELAGRFGWALLLPEQRRANNAHGCFNWFLPEHTARDHGEAGSIRSMIAHMVAHHALDPARVFITGLSAGGAFANVMLALYPDLFAAGAIIAGLPFGAAHAVPSALELMHRGQQREDRGWGDLIRAAAPPRRRPWPRIAVWQGLADTTVIPANADALTRQWLDVHGLGVAAGGSDRVGPAERTRWRGPDGNIAVERYSLAQFGHAVPISTASTDPQRCGAPGPFIVEAGLSSSYLIAQFWGIAPALPAPAPLPHAAQPGGVGTVLHTALKAAGLAS